MIDGASLSAGLESFQLLIDLSFCINMDCFLYITATPSAFAFTSPSSLVFLLYSLGLFLSGFQYFFVCWISHGVSWSN